MLYVGKTFAVSLKSALSRLNKENTFAKDTLNLREKISFFFFRRR